MALQSFESDQLANGLKIAYAPISCVRSLAIGLYIPTGARYESKTEAGVSHFLEHMVFKGCQGWPSALAIANEIEGRGGFLNASTSQEFTSFWIKIGARHWSQSLKLMAAMIRQPLLDAEEMARERGVILDEIAMYRDVPEEQAALLSNEAMWGEHPLGREIAGDAETVSALSCEMLRAFHASAYQPQGAVLTLAGQMDEAALHQAIAEDFGDWQGGGRQPTMTPAPSAPASPRYRIQSRDSEQAHLQLAVPGLPRLHPQRFALRLLNVLAGEGASSRLWQQLREEQGLTYNIGSFTSSFADAGVLGVYSGCDASRLYEALDGVMAVWRELQERPIPQAELARFKEYLRGRTELTSENPMSVAAWWGRQLATGDEPLSLDQALEQIDAVTASDIQQLAQELWQPQKLSLAYVGPVEAEERLVDWLIG